MPKKGFIISESLLKNDIFAYYNFEKRLIYSIFMVLNTQNEIWKR